MPSSTAGRYDIRETIGSGGMATVHLARLRGSAGFARAVAVKRLLPAYASDPTFSAMLLDEARLASRIRHPNVVPILDVVAEGDELFVVMEYVHGDSLSALLAAARGPLPVDVASAIMIGVLHGLHAAHVATGADGAILGIVHRDVSPHNVLVGVDGMARVLDFGIAKAAARLQTTAEGQIKGKISYMAREQLEGADVDARADVFAAGAVLWELLVGERVFGGRQTGEIVARVLLGRVDPPSGRNPNVGPELDAIVLRALTTDRTQRFSSALEMAEAIERTGRVATPRAIGAWVERMAGEKLRARADIVSRIERGVQSDRPPPDSDATLEMSDHGVLAKSQPNESTMHSAAFARETATSSPPKLGPAPRRGPRAAALVALLLGVVCGSALVFWAVTHRNVAPSAAPEPSVVAATTALVAPAPSAPTPVEVAPTITTPSASAAPIVASASAAPSASAPRRGRPSGARPAANRESCNPPYFVDANGIHVPKPQCLE